MMPTPAIFSKSRLEIYRQKIVAAQRIVAWIALREMCYCEADITRYPGLTHLSVSYGKRPAVKVDIK
jgi:hypothetical protein